MKKNELISLTITGMTAEGSGIGRTTDGMAVFVPLAAPGDILKVKIVKVKKTYAYGIIDTIETPSDDRITPDCASFRQCGGCIYRHMSYESECRAKYQRVADAMRRIGGFEQLPQPIISMAHPARYRNKAQYPVLPDGRVGFFALHSHRIIPCSDCFLQPEEFSAAAEAVGCYIRENHVSVYNEADHTGLIRHLYLRKAEATGEIMVVLVINGAAVPAVDSLIGKLQSALGDTLKSVQLNINRADTNVILGDICKVIYGDAYITDILCGVRVRISPLSFYQVNRDMAEILYRKAAEYAAPDGKNVLDLYCGAGTIGLSMATRAATVTGVELVAQAIADAEENAGCNHIRNARFLCADAAQAAQQLAAEGLDPDVVIVDPPRKGCSPELLHTIAEDFCPDRLVYVSCDPATLARDAALLHQQGYRLEEYTPVDLFPRTGHVETVALFKSEKFP